MQRRSQFAIAASMTVSSLSLPTGLAEGSDLVYREFSGFSQIAGVQGDQVDQLPSVVPQGETDSLLNMIKFGEKGDEPCIVSVKNESGDTETWNGCNSSSASTDKAIAGGALNKIRICTNDRSNERGYLVKGVESLWSRSAFGLGIAPMLSSRFSRPNCQDWGPWVECPVGSSAGAVRLHHRQIGGKDSLVGLQLVCHRTESTTPSVFREAWNSNTVNWAALSGVRLEDNQVIDYSLTNEPNGTEYFVSGLAVKESTDDPVRVGIFGHHSQDANVFFSGYIDLRNNINAAEHALRLILPGYPNNSRRRRDLAAGQFTDSNSSSAVFGNEGYVIRGVGVCLSTSQKVKGIRVTFIRRENNEIVDSYTSRKSLAHCQTWHQNSTCEDNEAVVGIRLLSTPQKGLTGLRVQCARVFREGSLLRP